MGRQTSCGDHRSVSDRIHHVYRAGTLGSPSTSIGTIPAETEGTSARERVQHAHRVLQLCDHVPRPHLL